MTYKIVKYTLSLSALLAVLLFVSCKSSTPKQLKHIPKDALVVFSLNAKRLNDKLADSKLSIDSLVKSVIGSYGATPADVKRLDDMKEAGIDWTSDVYGFYQTRGSAMTGTSLVMGAVAAVSSSSGLEAYLKKQKPDIVITKAAGGYSEARLNEVAVIGWNSDVVIVTAVVGNARYGNDGASEAAGSSAQLAALFEQKSDASIASVSGFKNLIKEKGDMLMWVNSQASLANIPQVAMVPKVAELVKDAYYGGVLNFENGKVVATYTAYTGRVMGDILKKHNAGTADLDMVNTYPSDNIAAFAVATLDPAIVLDIIRFLGTEGLANQTLANNGLNFTVEDLTKAVKGDFAVVASDIKTEDRSLPGFDGITMKQPDVKFLFTGKVGDKAAYEKVCAALVAKGLLVKSGAVYVPTANMGHEVCVLDEKSVFVASDSSIINQYKAGTGKAAIADSIKNEAKGKAGFAYVDFSKLLKTIPSFILDSASLNHVKVTVKDMVVTSDKLDNDVVKGKFELRTGNKQENSLASLIKMGSVIAANAKARRAEQQEIFNKMRIQVDSLSAVTVDSAFSELKRKP
jgi:hypothetical protein